MTRKARLLNMMKNTLMKKFKRISALLAAIAVLLCCAACGEDEGTNEFNQSMNTGTGADQTVNERNGTGFTHNHAVEAGFGIGMDTLEDIIGRYGQPLEQRTDEYTSVTISNAVYDFGMFEFEGAPGTKPVLTYVKIYSGIPAPCGISFTAGLEEAANTIFAGSGTGLMSESAPQKYFYGSDSQGEEYGRYTMLTIEFITSETNDTYALEYRADSYDEGHMTIYTLYFNSEYNMTWYSIRYV